jgi:hypothetical protein
MRAGLAHITFGYTPVMIEHLLDESLIWALRAGRDGMGWNDVSQAKLSEEIGLKQPVAYTPLEKEMVATHEAGHAVAAHLSGVGRRLEVLSIVKREDALGLPAHYDTQERWTRTRTELLAFLRIACAGMAAEEPAAQGGQAGRQGAARPAPAAGRGPPGRAAGARGADRGRDPGGPGRGRPGRAPAGPRRAQPAGAARRAGRSGPGRVGSPLEVT